jgi:hypothetical protein
MKNIETNWDGNKDKKKKFEMNTDSDTNRTTIFGVQEAPEDVEPKL